MFDVGFWELALIAVVALVVIGPEKLPGVARTMGYWIGRAKSFAASVQEDIRREVDKSEELKRLLEQQANIKEMHEIIENTVDEVQKSVSVNAHLPQGMPSQESSGQDADKHQVKPFPSTPDTTSSESNAKSNAEASQDQSGKSV